MYRKKDKKRKSFWRSMLSVPMDIMKKSYENLFPKPRYHKNKK